MVLCIFYKFPTAEKHLTRFLDFWALVEIVRYLEFQRRAPENKARLHTQFFHLTEEAM